MKAIHFRLVFDEATTPVYTAPPGYDGSGLKLGKYVGVCDPSITTLDLRALNIQDIGLESIPPCVSKVYLKSMPRSTTFPVTVKEIYADYADEIVWLDTDAITYLDISNFGLMDSYQNHKPQYFFTKDPSSDLLSLTHPNYDSSSVIFTQEFGTAMAVCSFTRKPQPTHISYFPELFWSFKHLR